MHWIFSFVSLLFSFAVESFQHYNKLHREEQSFYTFSTVYHLTVLCTYVCFLSNCCALPPFTRFLLSLPLPLSLFLSLGDESGSSKGSKIFASVPRLISFPNGRHGSLAASRNGGWRVIDRWVEGLRKQEIDRWRKRDAIKRNAGWWRVLK